MDGVEEQWKAIPQFEGYEVSDLGRVRSVRRVVNMTRQGVPYVRTMSGKQLSPRDHSGYRVVGIGRQKTLRVHRLVLEAFVGPCPEGMEACHCDGDRANNQVGNLRWDTRSENGLDRTRHGTDPQALRTHCPRGHLLAGANLVPSLVKRGRRSCLACSRAQSRQKNGPPIDMQSVSDHYYAQITGRL